MSELFDVEGWGTEEVEWLIGLTPEDDENAKDALSYFGPPSSSQLEGWEESPVRQWRVAAMKDKPLGYYAVLVAEKFERPDRDNSFQYGVEFNRGYFAHAALLHRPATPAEIAAILAAAADALDQDIPESMSAFIIELIYESGMSVPAVRRMCRHVVANESGRIKPVTFAPFLECVSKRLGEFRDCITDAAWAYERFDEALAYALEREPSMNWEAAGKRSEEPLSEASE